MSETPKSFKENFTDFAKSLGSSLNIFKQNVQQAISGVNTIALNNKDSLNLCWKISEDTWGGGGEVLNNYNQLIPKRVFAGYYGSNTLLTDDVEDYINTYQVIGDYSENSTRYSTDLSIDVSEQLEDGVIYEVDIMQSACGYPYGSYEGEAHNYLSYNGQKLAYAYHYTMTHNSHGATFISRNPVSFMKFDMSIPEITIKRYQGMAFIVMFTEYPLQSNS